ncbi:histidine phosphatase family protein [Leptolyngbya sp. FACHB-261]|uniref:histidine phosphatase family protein n=1 Tax=Leptolyngbya sp. FACHB-261 TaxID=2692806 RepID=UPI001689301B|nr:histidine phosphatase family protein [Leptolyngbya sp. FACHB-261]MBD2102790.1 histidine phosphatase family protein [Leptolyngbya sp. FACHB-261]
MTIYLLRHGQTLETELDYDLPVSLDEFNRLLRETRDIPLLEAGKARIREQARYLRQCKIQRIYASPFRRTRETAELVAAELGLEVSLNDDLREIVPDSLSSREGRTYTYRNLFIRSFLTLVLAQPGGTETIARSMQRVARLWDSVSAIGPDENILLVTHQGISRLLLLYLTPQFRWGIQKVDLSPAGLTVIQPRQLNFMGRR